MGIVEFVESLDRKKAGGRGEIRTHDTVSRTPDFESGALNHSATLPAFDYKRLKTQMEQGVGYVPSQKLYARIRVRGKLISKSSRLTKFSAAKLRPSDFENQERGDPSVEDSYSGISGDFPLHCSAWRSGFEVRQWRK